MPACTNFSKGVPGSRIKLYTDKCRKPLSTNRDRVCCKLVTVCPGRPVITSALIRVNPACCASFIAARAWSAVWIRPTAFSSASFKDCTPRLSRSKPSCLKAVSLARSTVPGLASIVASAGCCHTPCALSAVTIRVSCSVVKTVGVPPPKKRVAPLRTWRPRRVISRHRSATYRSCRSAPSPA